MTLTLSTIIGEKAVTSEYYKIIFKRQTNEHCYALVLLYFIMVLKNETVPDRSARQD